MSECLPLASTTLIAPPSSTPLRLLMVEDSPMDAELVMLTLEQAEVQFVYDIADSIALCRQYLKTSPYDAVLSDYRLPGFTAYQTLELLQESGQEIPLILVTGTLGEEAAVDCIKAGMTDYVLKERLFRLPMVLARSLQEFELRHQQKAAALRIRQQAQREAIINRIGQAMRETLVIDEVMQTTVDLLHDALQVDRCAIFTPDAANFVQIRHLSQATADRDRILGKQQCSFHTYFHSTLSEGRSIAISHISNQLPLEVREFAHKMQTQAVLTLPLLYQQQYLGGIALHQCDRPREWTVDEIDLVKAIADQCAIAIHQAQLFEQVQHQAQREKLLNQISRTLNSSLDPDYILQEIVKLTGECFAVDRAFIYSLQADQLQIINEWRASEAIASMLDFKAKSIAWADQPDRTTQDDLSRIFFAADFRSVIHSPTQQEQFAVANTLSVLGVPIFIRDQFFGGICLNTTTDPRDFTPDEVHLLQQIADQAAIALYNAQSYERLEKLVQERTQELEREKFLSDSANRAKSEFLAHMSHELRTPLTGILGFASLLAKQLFGDLNPKQQQYVDGISSCGQHLLELINDLLDLSKIEAGKEELFLEPVVVQEICDACITMIQERANQRGLQLLLTLELDTLMCRADKRRLRQILFNLLSNAVKFTEAGSVHLNVSQEGETIRFDIIDTGIGISIEDQAKLFQSFQQLDGDLNRKYEGTGLGLTLARKLARLHGGDITVTSEPGKGSCFTLHLPVNAPVDCGLHQ